MYPESSPWIFSVGIQFSEEVLNKIEKEEVCLNFIKIPIEPKNNE